tara:strand:+ start:1305 stop:2039 length:735 start_codon:yes stop_codon:yes gene_type:complete
MVCLDPYPHIVINEALPERLYNELHRTYISDESLKEFWETSSLENNKRYQIEGKLKWALDNNIYSKAWEEFIKYHTSKKFFKEVVQLFGEGLIKKYHPSLDKKFPNLMKAPVKIREKGNKDVAISMDVQPGINSPVLRRSSVIGPHVDNKNEIYAGLFYMRLNEDDSIGGNLQIYSHKDNLVITEKFDRKKLPDKSKLKLVKTIPYSKNTFVLFINSNMSFHGVADREITPYNRRLVNIIAEKK